MPHIQQLAPHVADLIAAGEVVERPASVVKELVENSLDAGATTVVVEIQHGGMALIRVTDNGVGIAPEELPTAFLRHATSKLRSAVDLAEIGTLGFRGEALAAISAVSRMEVFSRCSGAELGASLCLDGGVPGRVETAGCPEGTTFLVRNLFYNTPARLKFLKSDSAEASAVAGMLQQIALSHPEVSIRYIRDGREELHTPGDSKLLSAIYATRGRDFAMNLIPVDGAGEKVQVHGFVTDPLACRGVRNAQAFFCCGRMIKSKLLSDALESAYANRLMKGKFPGCVLHVNVPLDQVDVNVHPAKTVVRFASEAAVASAVRHVVSDALDKKEMPKQETRPVAAVVKQREDFYQRMDAKTFREQGAVRQPGQAQRRGSGPELSGRITFHDVVKPDLREDVPKPQSGFTVRTIEAKREEKVSFAGADTVETVGEQTAIEEAVYTPWRYAGEVLRTYIVAEDGDDVWLIDKHAAHERMNFDRFKANAEPIMSQPLVAPVGVDLQPEQYGILLENLPLLEEFGFEAEDFGTGCLMVRAIPSEIDIGLVRETLEMLADKLVSGGADPGSARDAMLHTLACKAAIKGGWKSDPAELKAIIEKVQRGEVQFCPHGRPVKVKLTKYEIEKMFKRA